MVEHSQSLILQCRLVFFDLKSSVRHAISQLLVDQFSKILDMIYNSVKSKVNQISDKLFHQGLRYGVSDGIFEAKKDQPKFQNQALNIAVVDQREPNPTI